MVTALMLRFRERLLEKLVERHAISEGLAQRAAHLAHPGVSAHVGEHMASDDPQAIEDMAGYAIRNTLSLKRLAYIDGQQAVIYKALKPNPNLGQNFEAMDSLEWLARMADDIPDPLCQDP
jgi:hypothetical protein